METAKAVNLTASLGSTRQFKGQLHLFIVPVGEKLLLMLTECVEDEITIVYQYLVDRSLDDWAFLLSYSFVQIQRKIAFQYGMFMETFTNQVTGAVQKFVKEALPLSA